jgi:hypothetical protein
MLPIHPGDSSLHLWSPGDSGIPRREADPHATRCSLRPSRSVFDPWSFDSVYVHTQLERFLPEPHVRHSRGMPSYGPFEGKLESIVTYEADEVLLGAVGKRLNLAKKRR